MVMPKEPDEKNRNKPLRVLRRQIGASQLDLSRWTGIPIDTIRDHENGRVRLMTFEIVRKISVAIGGAWDLENQRWVIGTLAAQTKKPLTPEFCKQYRAMLQSDPSPELQDMDLLSIRLRVAKLFERVPKSSWAKLAFRFNDYLEQCRRDFAPIDGTLKREFSRTQMRLAFSVDEQDVPRVQRSYSSEMGQAQPPHPPNFTPIRARLRCIMLTVTWPVMTTYSIL